MRIAFTHNLQLSAAEEEAEFDTPETIAAISDAIRRLGHIVEPVEVSGPASRVVARLEALGPDLVFNTAEGTQGRFREAFYPALFDRLQMPFTGSDAYVCTLTLDKRLTKTIVAGKGVPTPRWAFVDDVRQAAHIDLRFPLLAKPNFEGSSMGITVRSIVHNRDELTSLLVELLARYPAGVLVEEYVEGRDVTVSFLEGGSPATKGILEPAAYVFDVEPGRPQIYDLELKTTLNHRVHVEVPAKIPPESRARVLDYAGTVVRTLGIRDIGRVDFRITPTGEVFFLEVNALPSLELGAALYQAAARVGLDSMDDVLDVIIKSAAERYGLSVRNLKRSQRRVMPRVGLIYNLRRTPNRPGSEDREAEFDTPTTIKSIHEAIASYGHEVVEFEATAELPTQLHAAEIDVVFNIAEGFRGRYREALVPALLELMNIPYTGSDPTALSLAQDKAVAKRIVSEAGILASPHTVMTTGKERLHPSMTFPVIVKPVAEGSSKGVLKTSVVADEPGLRALAKELIDRYGQAVLVEPYLPGREFTVGLLGEKRPELLPILEVVFTDTTEQHPIYSFAHKFGDTPPVRSEVPAKIDEKLARQIERAAKGAFRALGCRDFARIDFRLDAQGRVNFMECNPLPGLAPGFSDFCLIAEAGGLSYRTLVGEILAPCIRRWRSAQRARRLEGRF